MNGGDVDPWSTQVCRFRILDAQVMGTRTDGDLWVRYGLTLQVEEGRYEALMEDEDGRPAPSILAYGCFVTLAGAGVMDSWTGNDMHVVITGRYENGRQVTLAGDGALGFDDKGSLQIQFEEQLRMVAHEIG